MKLGLIAAGLAQLALAGGSLAIPAVLDWSEDTAKLRSLTRQVFWTYAGYIWATNVCFGLVSVFFPESLLDGSLLARLVSGYIAIYWGARVLVQFLYFDRTHAPSGLTFKIAEVCLVSVFVSLTLVYALIACTS